MLFKLAEAFMINLDSMRMATKSLFSFQVTKRQLKAFLGLLLLTFFWGCSEYQQVLNSKDQEKKFQKAKEYYNNDEFQKALTLFDDIRTYYRGTKRGQKIAYYHAYSHFGVGSYRIAAFRFKTYYETYSRSDKAEDALYMQAFCLFKQSPRVELDQKTTKKAINAFQFFMEKYPNSDRIPKCNKYMDKLNTKLQQKAFEKAHLWYQILDYKAAITAFKNLLEQYPAIDKRERVEYLLVDSYWKVAEQSVQSKKAERYQKTVQRAQKFLQTYPGSKHIEDVKSILNKAKESLARYNT